MLEDVLFLLPLVLLVSGASLAVGLSCQRRPARFYHESDPDRGDAEGPAGNTGTAKRWHRGTLSRSAQAARVAVSSRLARARGRARALAGRVSA